jgi:hypothetical protein
VFCCREQREFRGLLLTLNIFYIIAFHPIEQNFKDLTGWELLIMFHRKFWVFAICLGLLLMMVPSAFARDVNAQDLAGISPQNHKYVFSVLGGAAAGAGLGFLLGGGQKTAKLALLGGGGMSSWYLTSHRYALGKWHDWAMIGSNTGLGMGIGWTICDCDNGLIAGALLGGGGTAAWQALKSDRPARNAYNKVKGQ